MLRQTSITLRQAIDSFLAAVDVFPRRLVAVVVVAIAVVVVMKVVVVFVCFFLKYQKSDSFHVGL